MSEQLMLALESLRAITSADDMRWLAAHIATALGQWHNLRGIGFKTYEKGPALQQTCDLISALPAVDLNVVGLVADLLHEALRPKTDSARGQVQIKTVVRLYTEIDFETDLPKLDADGNEIQFPVSYHYAYIRLYAGKGDSDRKRRKFLSIYADRGMGKGGRGGFVAAALAQELITENEVLDAYHGERYPEFLDQVERIIQSAAPDDTPPLLL